MLGNVLAAKPKGQFPSIFSLSQMPLIKIDHPTMLVLSRLKMEIPEGEAVNKNLRNNLQLHVQRRDDLHHRNIKRAWERRLAEKH